LIISDVPGNSLPDIASGMTAPDPTTFQDAINVLKEFDLWNSAPRSVTHHLEAGSVGRIPETPKPGNEIFRKVHNVIVADNRTACQGVRRVLDKSRIPAKVLTSSLDMEARSLGRLLASIASNSKTYGQPLKPPSALVLGGETTVDVKGNGRGGRNQEVALAALTGIAGLTGVAIAAIGTDGIDGNSPAAGALVDGESMAHASRLGMHVRKYMARNDAYGFFRKLGDSITTGPTGTNVSDVYLLVRAK
jgi:glycerate-2-kinase